MLFNNVSPLKVVCLDDSDRNNWFPESQCDLFSNSSELYVIYFPNDQKPLLCIKSLFTVQPPEMQISFTDRNL